MSIGNFTNFAVGHLVGGIEADSTELRLVSGHAASFRQDAPFEAIVWNSTDFPSPEWAAKKGEVAVIMVTAKTGDVFTIETGSDADFPLKALNAFNRTYEIRAPLMADLFNTVIPAAITAP